MSKPLSGKIALVAGATRGAGRGIARALGEQGTIVYCSGRSSRSARRRVRTATGWDVFDQRRRPETIEETAEMVTEAGGLGIPVRADHLKEPDVRRLMRRIEQKHGRLDILVNDIWGGDSLTEWGKPFWESSLEKGLKMLTRAIHTHIITARLALPLMLKSGGGLVVEITDGNTLGYRGNFYYDLVKTSVIRMAFALSRELKQHKITSVAVTPGFLRSEAMLEYFEVTADHWQSGAKKEPAFAASETPLFVGRAVAALASDPAVFEKTGRVFSSWGLSHEYGFTDADGSKPDWGAYADRSLGENKLLSDIMDSHNEFVRMFDKQRSSR